MSGAVHRAVRLTGVGSLTDSAVGTPGGSSTSVTVTVMVCDAVFARPAAPDDAVTTTT